jgi:acyl-CoA reductase-like NAD-dependent aldehyde dehydrogenase
MGISHESCKVTLQIMDYRLPTFRRISDHMNDVQGCVFTKDINKAMLISDAMETGTVQINSAPARGPDHFPFQVN